MLAASEEVAFDEMLSGLESGPISSGVGWQSSLSIKDRSGEQRPVVIRALNHDNSRDIQRLVELFASHYGVRYPLHDVYEKSFWFNGEEPQDKTQRINSIVADDGNKILGHLAVRHNGAADYAEILLPAVHTQFKKDLFRLTKVIWQCVKAQACKQNWKHLFQYHFTTQPLSQIVDARCFGSKEFALIPSGLLSEPNEEINGADSHDSSDLFAELTADPKHVSLLVMYQCFRSTLDAPMTLYPPRKHWEIARELLYGIGGHERIFVEDSLAPDQGQKSFQANGRSKTLDDCIVLDPGFYLSTLPRLGMVRAKVIPSELEHPENVKDEICSLTKRWRGEGMRPCVFVAMDDPLCPSFCEDMEDRGFYFSGVLPRIHEHDYVVYAGPQWDSINNLSLHSNRAKRLRDYITAQAQTLL